MVILQARNIQYKYHDGTYALCGASLDIKKGELLAILGPNGSGKTTLLKHLNGLLKPETGEILLEQKSLGKYSSKQVFQKVGMVFQDPNDQLFAPSVKEDVAFGPLNLGLSKDEIAHRVDEALSLVGMTLHANKAVDALSFGQKKRVCIAGVLAMKPEILVLDEPTCGMSPEETESTMIFIKKLVEERGLSILFTEHDMSVVFGIAKRISVLHQGTLIADGKPEEVRANEEVQKVYLGGTA